MNDFTNQELHILDLLAKPKPGYSEIPAKESLTFKFETHLHKPAISHGLRLEQHDQRYENSTLSDALNRVAKSARGIRIIEDNGTELYLLYAELLELARNVARGLRDNSIHTGEFVILNLSSRKEFIVTFWACQLLGAIPIPVDLSNAAEDSDALASFQLMSSTLGRAHLVCSTSETLTTKLGHIEVLFFKDLTSQESHNFDEFPSIDPKSTALLLATSGSTGTPKLVAQSHESILSRCQASCQHDEFTENDISLNFLPLDHVGGLVMFHIRDVWCGNEQIQASMSLFLQKPINWLDWLETYRVSITWAPNFAFALINTYADEIKSKRWDLSRLRFILNGGERIVPSQAEAFISLMHGNCLPKNAMRPAWGMSETCSGITSANTYHVNRGPSHAVVSVGSALPGVSLRIVNSDGSLKECGEEGELQVKGPSITPGYFNNDEANNTSFTEDGWFRTGDLAVLDEHENLYITGRIKDVLIINGRNISLSDIESSLSANPSYGSFSISALANINAAGEERLVIILGHNQLEDSLQDIKGINQHVVSQFNIAVDAIYFLPIKEIERTAIGKINKYKLLSRLNRGELEAFLEYQKELNSTGTIPNAFYKQSYFELTENIYNDHSNSSFALLCNDKKNAELIAGSLSLDSKQFHFIDFNSLEDGIINSSANYVIYLDGLNKNCTPLTFAENIISLAKLYHAKRPTKPVIIPTTNALGVINGDITVPELAIAIGLIESINQELGTPLFRVVDLDVNHLTDFVELFNNPLPFNSIAFRRNKIYRLGISQIDLTADENRGPAFSGSDVVLITGGLGGVAFEIGKQIIKYYGASLLLVGRSPLPDQKQAIHFERFHTLNTTGNVAYISVDISNQALFSAAISAYEKEHAVKISGVIHTAGVLASATIEALTKENLHAVLSAKKAGSENLFSIFEERKGFKFIGISSMTSQFGGYGLASYSAANAFMDAYWRSKQELNTWLVNYGRWYEVGMSSGMHDAQALKAEGYLALNPSQASQGLLAIIERSPGQYLYGLDPTGKLAKAYSPNRILENPSATTHNNRQNEQPIDTLVQSIFETLLDIDHLPITENYFDFGVHSLLIPKLQREICEATGVNIATVDFFKLPTLESLSRSIQEQLPKEVSTKISGASQLDEQVTSIFTRLLDIDTLPTDESYFDYGVHSLLIPKLQNEIFEATGVNLPAVEFFKLATLENILIAIRAQQSTSCNESVVEKLKAIFADILELSSFSIDDNYFDFGLHSLLIPKLQAKIHNSFGLNVPTVEVFKCISISGLAAYIESELSRNDASSNEDVTIENLDPVLVTMKNGKGQHPLFLIHDGDGETMLYSHLASHCHKDRPVYAIKPHALPNVPIAHTRLNEIATHYIRAIKTVQPEGPYLLGGLCAGGVIAFEMACQLEKAGEKIGLVALIDAADDQSAQDKSWHHRNRVARLTETLSRRHNGERKPSLFHTALMLSRKFINAISYECKSRYLWRKNAAKMKLFRECLDKQTVIPEALHNIPVRIVYQYAARTSNGNRYANDVVLFKATQRVLETTSEFDDTPNSQKHRDPLFGWGNRVSGKITTYDVSGGHSSCLHEPYVVELANKIEAHLHKIMNL